MNNTISPIRGPFENATEFLDSLWSEQLRLERLNAIEQRLKQDHSILAQVNASHIARMLDLLPLRVFDDWVPSEQFLEDFYAGNVIYDQSGQMVGGPPGARLGFSEEEQVEESGIRWRSSDNAAKMHVESEIFEFFRRTISTTGESEKLLAETKFWPLLEDLDHLGLIYGPNNPVIESMDFLSLYLSQNLACPKDAGEKLKEILRFVFDQCKGEELAEIIGIARYAVDGGQDANIFSLLREKFSPVLAARSNVDANADPNPLHLLFEPISQLDKNTLRACIATLPRFFERIEERNYAYWIFGEEAREGTAPHAEDGLVHIEIFLYEIIVKLAAHYDFDMSRSSIASMKLLGSDAFSNWLDSESPTIFDVALEARKSEDGSLAHVSASEIIAVRRLIYSIEKARLRQIAFGNPVFLDARGLFPSEGEALALPRKAKKPKLGSTISKIQVLLRNSDGYRFYDLDFGLVLSIAEDLRDAGFARIGANVLAMFFEVRLSEGMQIATEGLSEEVHFSHSNAIRLLNFFEHLGEGEKTTLAIAIGRLFPVLDNLEQKRFRGLFPNSVLANRKYVSAVAILTEEIGKDRWDKLKDGIQHELEVGESLYRVGINKDWHKSSSRAPVNHWAAAIEGIFYGIWNQSFDKLQRDDLNDPIPRKLDSGTASLAEMVNFFLDVQKRLKKSEANVDFLDVFQDSKFSRTISNNEEFRRHLKLLGAIRGKAAHYSDDEKSSVKILPTDVFSFRQHLISSGLLASLIDCID